jgi:hypothetical protein
MKFLKKASLAASIAAVSFAANAELVAMDEMSMAAATGQAGIDLDISLTGTDAITIGEILYTDTADNDGDGGQLAITGVQVGVADAANGDAQTITLLNKIDIKEDGSIVIDGSATNVQGLTFKIDNVETRAASGLVGSGANLASDVSLTMNVIGSTTTIAQSGTDTTITMSGGSVDITDGSATLLNGAIGISGLQAYNMVDDGTGTGTLVRTGLSTDATLTFNGNGIGISDLDLAGTIDIANVSVGGSSIGSLAISNLALNNATIQISGH